MRKLLVVRALILLMLFAAGFSVATGYQAFHAAPAVRSVLPVGDSAMGMNSLGRRKTDTGPLVFSGGCATNDPSCTSTATLTHIAMGGTTATLNAVSTMASCQRDHPELYNLVCRRAHSESDWYSCTHEPQPQQLVALAAGSGTVPAVGIITRDDWLRTQVDCGSGQIARGNFNGVVTCVVEPSDGESGNAGVDLMDAGEAQ
jgi:hypothetical protein